MNENVGKEIENSVNQNNIPNLKDYESKLLDYSNLILENYNESNNSLENILIIQNLIKNFIFECESSQSEKLNFYKIFKSKVISDCLFRISFLLLLIKVFESKTNQNEEIFFFSSQNQNVDKKTKIKLNHTSLKNFIENCLMNSVFVVQVFKSIYIDFYNNEKIEDYQKFYFLPDKKYFINFLINFPEKSSNYSGTSTINSKTYYYTLISEFYISGFIDDIFIMKLSKLTYLFEILNEIVFFFNRENPILLFYLVEFMEKDSKDEKKVKEIQCEFRKVDFSNETLFFERINKYKILVFQIIQTNFLDEKFISFFSKSINSRSFDFFYLILKSRNLEFNNLNNSDKINEFSMKDFIKMQKALFFEYFLLAYLDKNHNEIDEDNLRESDKIKELEVVQILNFDKLFKKILMHNNFILAFISFDDPSILDILINNSALMKVNIKNITISNEKFIDNFIIKFSLILINKFIESLNRIIDKSTNFIENLNNSEFYNLLVFLFVILHKVDKNDFISKNNESNSISYLNLVLSYQGKMMGKNLTYLKKALFDKFNKSFKRLMQDLMNLTEIYNAKTR